MITPNWFYENKVNTQIFYFESQRQRFNNSYLGNRESQVNSYSDGSLKEYFFLIVSFLVIIFRIQY